MEEKNCLTCKHGRSVPDEIGGLITYCKHPQNTLETNYKYATECRGNSVNRYTHWELDRDSDETNQAVKADRGKLRLTLVPKGIVKVAAKLEEYDQESNAMNRPKMICKTRKRGNDWRGLFECPYCGESFEADVSNVRSGRTRSCGCNKGRFMIESKGTHGASKTRLYRIWRHIKERCDSPNCKEYKWYGERGISCEFDSFEKFRDYAIANGYNDNLTCERIDVNGNYAPGNITFIPLQLQAINTRSNVKISYKGLTLCAAEWADIIGINQNTITKRIRSGWSEKKTLETSVNNSLDISLVPIQIISDIRAVRLFGCMKYGSSENWKQVEPERYRDAAFRHFCAYLDDPQGVDEESGLPHLSHLACNVAFLCALERRDKNEKN